jgi:hypothetical protein
LSITTAFLLLLSQKLQTTTIESTATHPGDWAFNATGYLYWQSLEN